MPRLRGLWDLLPGMEERNVAWVFSSFITTNKPALQPLPANSALVLAGFLSGNTAALRVLNGTHCLLLLLR